MGIDQRDVLNQCETKIVTWLQNDTEIEANYVHEKYISSLKNYNKKQLPAIGIHCYGILPLDGMLQIEGNCEIVTAGAIPQADTDCKKVVAQVYYSFKKRFIPGCTILSDFAKVEPISAEAIPARLIDGFYHIGSVKFRITLIGCKG